MATPTIFCPSCNGPHMPNHPAGALAWKHTADCMIRASEDGRAAADADRLLDAPAFTRDITEVEKILLGTLGWAGVEQVGIKTFVRDVTASVRHRSWPQLHSPTPPIEEAP